MPWRLLMAAAIVAAGIAIGVSPAGSEVADWVRDKLGRDRVASVAPVEPVRALCPRPGGFSSTAPNGVWVVNEDGGKRRVGAYEGATWSPQGLFVGAWTDRELVALDPTTTDGIHWTVSQRGISVARWAPSGFRVAYLARSALRVVIGNGADDRLLAAPVAPVAPAWRPGAQHVVAYADRLGRVIASTWTPARTSSERRARRCRSRSTGLQSEQLVVLTEQRLRTSGRRALWCAHIDIPRRLYTATALAARPNGNDVAYSVYSERTGQGTIFLFNGRFSRPLFSAAVASRTSSGRPTGSCFSCRGRRPTSGCSSGPSAGRAFEPTPTSPRSSRRARTPPSRPRSASRASRAGAVRRRRLSPPPAETGAAETGAATETGAKAR